MTKNIKFVITRFFIFKLKMHQNPFSAEALPRIPLGELTTLPRPPSRLGRGYPLPIGRGYPLPIALPARRLRFSGPLNTKSWLRRWSIEFHFRLLSPSHHHHRHEIVTKRQRWPVHTNILQFR